MLKKVITLFSLFILISHFTTTIIFNSPFDNSYINKYMLPIFNQNWKFFAPDPQTESRTLYFRYSSNNNPLWSAWINPGKLSQAKFDYNRSSYHGKIVNLNATICHYLKTEIENITNQEEYFKLQELEKKSFFNKEISKSGSTYLIKNYLKNWTLWRYQSNVKKLQFILAVKDTKSSKISYILFPTIAYEGIEN